MTAIVHEIVRASSEQDVVTDESPCLSNHVVDQCEGSSEGAEPLWRENVLHSPVWVDLYFIILEMYCSICYFPSHNWLVHLQRPCLCSHIDNLMPVDEQSPNRPEQMVVISNGMASEKVFKIFLFFSLAWVDNSDRCISHSDFVLLWSALVIIFHEMAINWNMNYWSVVLEVPAFIFYVKTRWCGTDSVSRRIPAGHWSASWDAESRLWSGSRSVAESSCSPGQGFLTDFLFH